ncbi:MAG TPA: hypothetical protein VIG76_11710 [Amnibacterium sp.]|jgi:hypothetical protein|uniref:hypothetical protein n=1 Tax=Amnibacterium sp. TaxID=1872496 RepID=UPI002F95C8D3
MSYIELPVAEYRRRLAALPARPADAADAAAAQPGPSVGDVAVRAARSRYPRAFAALDAEQSLTAEEITERERLIMAAIDAVQGAPDQT